MQESRSAGRQPAAGELPMIGRGEANVLMGICLKY